MEDVLRRARNLKRDTRVEVYSNIDNRRNLIIAQRSQGMWLVQLPERNESHKMEKKEIMKRANSENARNDYVKEPYIKGLHKQFSQKGLTNRSTSTRPRPVALKLHPHCHETAANPAEAPRFSKNLSSQSLNADHVSLLALLYLLLAVPLPQKKASARKHLQEAAKEGEGLSMRSKRRL
ncbi:hypothetical protein SASPL_133481 [Salvia splendens]|uniref:Uncharacterized protein n=1 Tax=Salvia splendens TaxID=180675 RepID=A0A8X8ZI32_SALSN|nr:hypothetical protein SASPL_133481 [Salvia splendens]